MQRSRGGEACWHALLVAAGVKDVAAQQAAAAAAHARVAHPELLDGAAGVGVRLVAVVPRSGIQKETERHREDDERGEHEGVVVELAVSIFENLRGLVKACRRRRPQDTLAAPPSWPGAPSLPPSGTGCSYLL
jgi:hypothetical protein